jgi:hypothetical protein
VSEKSMYLRDRVWDESLLSLPLGDCSGEAYSPCAANSHNDVQLFTYICHLLPTEACCIGRSDIEQGTDGIRTSVGMHQSITMLSVCCHPLS